MAGKSNIVDHLADSVDGLTKKQAGEAFDEVVAAIADMLASGERVSIPGLGSFSVAHRPARTGRNPATQKTITIPASKNVKFKIAKDFKDRLNG